jgi:alpha-L-arabinofuranosidase
MQAANTRDAPDTVAPRAHREARVAEGQLRARLQPGSWNVFVLQHRARSTT